MADSYSRIVRFGRKHWRIATSGLGVLLFAAFLFSASDAVHKCEVEEKDWSAGHRQHSRPVWAARLYRRVNANIFCAASADDVWEALSGLAVAAFTFTLWRSTEKLWDITRQAVDDGRLAMALARDEFHASHRPLVVVRDIHKGVFEGHSCVDFSIVNIGDAACTIIEQGIDLVIVSDGRFAQNVLAQKQDGSGIRSLGPGERESIKIGVNLAENIMMLPEDVTTRVTGSVHLCINFVYVDGLGHKRRTVAQRRYDRGTETFIDLGNPNYEYQD